LGDFVLNIGPLKGKGKDDEESDVERGNGEGPSTAAGEFYEATPLELIAGALESLRIDNV